MKPIKNENYNLNHQKSEAFRVIYSYYSNIFPIELIC